MQKKEEQPPPVSASSQHWPREKLEEIAGRTGKEFIDVSSDGTQVRLRDRGTGEIIQLPLSPRGYSV